MMDIILNAPVECIDGESGGHVTGLILKPNTNEFTHLVIRSDGSEHIVPADLVRDANLQGVLLDCTATRLDDQPPFVKTDYIRSPVAYYGFFPGSVKYVPTYLMRNQALRHTRMPEGESEIKTGMAIYAKDGYLGRIDDVVVNPENKQVTHIVLRKGHLWDVKEDVIIGITQVEAVKDDGIYLKTTKTQISTFSVIHTTAEEEQSIGLRKTKKSR